MHRIYKFVVFIICTCIFISCNKDKKQLDDKPSLTFMSASTDVIYFQRLDTLHLNFLFEDGGNNLGYAEDGIDSTFVILDQRPGDEGFRARYTLPMPYIPKKDRTKSGNLVGDVSLSLMPAFHYPRMDTLHVNGRDTVYWHVYMQDMDGNASDTIVVGPIYIMPN